MEPIKYLGYNRRDFLKLTGMAGAVFGLAGFATKKENKIVPLSGMSDENVGLNHLIFIDKDSQVTLVNHRPEMGQGVYQSMPMLIAEELEINLKDIQVIQSGADREKYGHQQVGGSSSVRKSWTPSRQLGAAARMMLVQAAAEQWAVPVGQCSVQNGVIRNNSSGAELKYGEVVEKAATYKVPTDIKLKSKGDFKVLGKSLPRLDAGLKTNGKAVFSLDMEVEGMVYATMLRSPTFVGKIESFNKEEVAALPGVLNVLKIETPVFSFKRQAVAIVAENYPAALKAKKALKVKWNNEGVKLWSEKEVIDKFQSSSEVSGVVLESEGDMANLEQGASQMEATYYCPYQAHACMEPMNAIVQVDGDSCTFWGGVQSPNWIKSTLANYLSIPEKNVEMNISFLGGGFGRKAFTDFALEAASISKEMKRPIKLIWTREDDISQGPFRPAALYKMSAYFNKKNEVTGLKNKLITQDMGHQWPGANKEEVTQWIFEGANKNYGFSNFELEAVPMEFPIPVMWWRSVYASTNGFAHESFIDELASALKKDPIAYRKTLLKNKKRESAVLDQIKKMSGWNNKKQGTGLGVAMVESFGSICAQAVQVSKNNKGSITIEKVYVAMDCGMTVNPDIIGQQVEGSIVMGLTAAIKSKISFEQGMAVEKNFDKFKMLRIHESPEVQLHIMDNEEAPGGVGEPALPPIAPALTNAIFDLTGKRIRTLPFDLNEI